MTNLSVGQINSITHCSLEKKSEEENEKKKDVFPFGSVVSLSANQ